MKSNLKLSVEVFDRSLNPVLMNSQRRDLLGEAFDRALNASFSRPILQGQHIEGRALRPRGGYAGLVQKPRYQESFFVSSRLLMIPVGRWFSAQILTSASSLRNTVNWKKSGRGNSLRPVNYTLKLDHRSSATIWSRVEIPVMRG